MKGIIKMITRAPENNYKYQASNADESEKISITLFINKKFFNLINTIF